MRRFGRCIAAVLVSGICCAPAPGLRAEEPTRPSPALPGSTFQSEETRQRERDAGANPGMLWVEQGAELWTRSEGAGGKSCASCHGRAEDAMRGVAARYPAFDGVSGGLLNIEQRINRCRTVKQSAVPLAWESGELLGLTAFVTHVSRGVPRHVVIDGPAAPYFARGREFFETRQGQLNLACSQCHTDNVGRRLRGDAISQAQSDSWPAYRLEWQTAGSLHRRLRACSLGVRAEILPFGAPEYVALELYLAWRGEGLPIASPGIRR